MTTKGIFFFNLTDCLERDERNGVEGKEMASAKYALDLNQWSGREVKGRNGGKQESVAPPLCAPTYLATRGEEIRKISIRVIRATIITYSAGFPWIP